MDQDANQSVIVFGAGEAGRRALACLRREPAWDVVAFTDNATQRHGTTFEGLPVIPPGSLRTAAVDRVVVASDSMQQILPQLRALGMNPSCIDVYQAQDDAIHPIPPEQAAWPRILVLTEDSISPGHGIGAVLLRQFGGYPSDRLLHAYLRPTGEPFLPHSFRVAALWESQGSDRNERAALTAAELVTDLQMAHGRIDAVYSAFSSEAGLTFLAELLDVLPKTTPVVHHAHTLREDSDAALDALLRTLSPRITEFWAIGPALADRLREATHRDVIMMDTFSRGLAPTWKRDHREVDSTFKVVMLGNSHLPWTLDKLRRVWAEVRRHCGIGPIQWLAYPTSLLHVTQAGVHLEPDIEYQGYLNDRLLHEQLCSADLAILPFNIADAPECGYARYSIPSRLGELMNAGLPTFAAAGQHSELRRFITSHGIGRCSTLADTEQFTRDLLAFVRDASARRILGAAARNFALGQWGTRRDRLFDRLGALTQFDFDRQRHLATRQ